MRKNMILTVMLFLLVFAWGCGDSGEVKVYDVSDEAVSSHEEVTITAVISQRDLEQNIFSFIECTNGTPYDLIYHGGVGIYNAYGDVITLSDLADGSVVDVCFYSDTMKLVSITKSDSAYTKDSVTKFAADVANGKAKYKGTTCLMAEHVVAFDKGSIIDVTEINLEDQVTLNFYNDVLVSVNIELGHGYVRLTNHDTYIGGMVEIGYDVIVPVTSDMLIAVREGSYTLRINKNGFSNSKPVVVTRDNETTVNIGDIAIPTGTATFTITPTDAVVYVNGDKIAGHTYTGLYGNYDVKIEAEGYKTFNGGFNITKTVNTFTVNLVALEDEDDDEEDDDSSTTESTTEEPETNVSSTEGTTTEESTTGESTTEDEGEEATPTDAEIPTGEVTSNKITIKTPVGASVYVDGEYVGIAPVSFTKVVGAHTITLYKSGYLIKSYTIQAANDGKDDEYSFADLTSLLDLVE